MSSRMGWRSRSTLPSMADVVTPSIEHPETAGTAPLHPRVMVVTGMSGAGRSTVAKVLEDLGYFVIDNLPPGLMGDVVALNDVPEGRKRLAVVVDSRGGLPSDELQGAVNRLRAAGVETTVLFVDADDAALVRRYSESRRPHPVPAATITESIAAERALLGEIREGADLVIDTTDTNVHQLRRQVEERFRDQPVSQPMQVALVTFGYKHGVPREADLVFDCRFLPNPHWVPELRPQTGKDPAVSKYVMGNPDAVAFLDRVEDLLGFLIPRFREEAKSYLTIAIGCTGGRHRSVTLAEELRRWLEEHHIAATIRHRDIDR